MTLISEDMVQSAFDWLNENTHYAAKAKADRIRAAYAVKRAKAEAFLKAKGTVMERESEAICDIDYDLAVDLEISAIEKDEFCHNNRSKCIAIIDAWRTESATIRGMGRIG